jgi:N-acyl-phosphatidylethanolamine-hydrolysing phospholipase D
VLIPVQHDHYDHFDELVVKHLKNDTHWVVPHGMGTWLRELGIRNSSISELKWWDKLKVSENLEIVCTPCQHWSKRKWYTRNTTLVGLKKIINLLIFFQVEQLGRHRQKQEILLFR